MNGYFELVTPKNDKSRILPLPELSKKLVLPLILSTEAGKLVFTAAEGGPIRHSNFMRRDFAPALSKAGIQDFTFHELRHTAVSHLIASGANILTISKIVGHANPSITLNVYSHMLPDALEGVKKAMDNNFESARTERMASGN